MGSLIKTTLAVLALTMLAGCATTAGNFCDVGRQMHPTDKDVDTMSDQLVEDVLSHNNYGARACGWK